MEYLADPLHLAAVLAAGLLAGAGNTIAGGGYASISATSTAANPPTTTDPVVWNNLALFTANPQSEATSTLWTRSSSPYTVSNSITITLAGRATLNFQVVSTVTPTPAPAGLVMVAGALPFVGFGLIRRRLRKGEPVTAA